MFICNIQLKQAKKFVLFFILFLLIISILIFLYSIKKSHKTQKIDNCIPQTEYAEIPAEHYTSILKLSHEDIKSYVGKKIKFTGFVYRLYDFTDTQFVLAREMIISSDSSNNKAQAVVVGFLCNCDSAKSFADGSWIEVEATIESGYYHSEIPILNIVSIKSVDCPENPYVYPPNSSYVKTEKL